MSIVEGPLTSLAFCWIVERHDGAGLALTSHDQTIERDGVRYAAAPGMMPAAIVRRAGMEAGSSEVSGAVTSTALSAGDLAAGRWDGAGYALSAVDWTGASSEVMALASGQVGEVGIDGEHFAADLHGAAARLDSPACPVTSPTCRAALGDAQCRVDLAGRLLRGRVVASNGDGLTLDVAVDARFLFGRLRFLSGTNAGLATVIAASSGTGVRMREMAAGAVAVGDRVELREGCDKLFTTCASRFVNALNFRGEPHVPGNDLLTRYPGA